MNEIYAEYVPVLKALTDETRLKIIDMLSCGGLCACDILEEFSITQPTLSYHMKILSDSGLVNAVRDRSWVRYTLNKENADMAMSFLKDITNDKKECICKNKIGAENMDEMKNGGCCSGSTGCCGNVEELKPDKKELVIDFLYLDLSVCTRCQGAENNLDEALEEVTKVIEATGMDVQVNKININTKQLAITHKFLSSPTIRVNNQDIQMAFKESLCESCGDFCGDSVDCRVWVYQGNEYTEPPKAMIIEGILKAVYGSITTANPAEKEYVMPENLEHFYDVMDRK